MNREEFQKEITNRFKNTDSGFGNMTQRELILLQIASNIYHAQINFNLNDVNKCDHDYKPCKHPAVWEFDKCTKCGEIR